MDSAVSNIRRGTTYAADGKDALIKPPSLITVSSGDDGTRATLFFKPFRLSRGMRHARNELYILKKIATAQTPMPPDALRETDQGNTGYTFGWVDKEKAGKIEGDKQGFGKIIEGLNLRP
ncbi:hypothetical protein F4861DRAFT_542515 [Xylaria intraflava]|nr:hypothetical protein F4861DRAFT_542515 [Xylaria intraflava]